jgi:Cu-Zn family superoxide dismutase
MNKLLIASAVLSLGACAQLMPAGPKATAELKSLGSNTAKGNVTFVQTAEGKVKVSGSISGLKANAEHGFHVHEKGDCSAADGMSAGGHFNPAATKHGGHDMERHGGDMPNLKTDAQGNVSFNVDISGVNVAAGPNSIVGRGLIVHRDPDDYKSQPAGNAGPRVACAVIQAS